MRLQFKKYFILTILSSFILIACGNTDGLLIDKLNIKDMSEIAVNLSEQGIVCRTEKKEDGSYNVYVSSKDYPIARQILLSSGVIRNTGRDDLLKLITKSSMVENPSEQQFKFNQILSQELAYTLSNLYSVVSADVYISAQFDSAPDNMDLNNQPDMNNLKASVYLKVNSTVSNPNVLINNAKKIVAGAVKGLNTDNIYVVIENN